MDLRGCYECGGAGPANAMTISSKGDDKPMVKRGPQHSPNRMSVMASRHAPGAPTAFAVSLCELSEDLLKSSNGRSETSDFYLK